MVVNATGHCCGAGFAAVDVNGHCCASSADIDACGVCGGDGVAVDVAGTCCRSALPPSGLCCADASGQPVAVDDCGVCGGVHRCGAAVKLNVELAVSVTPDDTWLTRAADAVATMLSLPPAVVSRVTMYDEADTGSSQRLLVRDAPLHRRVSVVPAV
jgi:hypothetical protein